ncbi:MAG: CARDB domain-containing protein, partial [Patescibacteria group bacterium]
SFFQATADLSVTDVTTNPKATDIVAGKPVTVSASIKNNSNIIRAEPSQVSFKVDDNSSASTDIFYTQTIDFIQPGDYRAVSFTWTPSITGNHRIEICADYTNNITELDEANNCAILYTNTNSDSISYLPKISMYSSPVNISKGGTSSLIWNSNNTTGCYASDGWSGYKSTSGSETIYPENSRNYTITCYNSYGQNSATATIFVGNQSISQNFVASCITDPASTSIGRQVVFAAGQAGAKGDVTYTWSGDVYGTGILKKVSFDSSGIKTAIVTVKDDAGRIATAQCQTKINGAISTFISKIIKPKPPVVTQVTKNICDCQVQKAIDETEELYNETQNEPTTQNIVQTGVAVAPAGLVLTLGLDSAAKFFLWSSVILTNFFLIAALFLMFMYVSRNYSRKDE